MAKENITTPVKVIKRKRQIAINSQSEKTYLKKLCLIAFRNI